MTSWLVAYEETWFCYSLGHENNTMKKLNESLFCAVMGLIYIFSFVSVNDKPTRYRYAFYYSVCCLENVTSVVLWYAYGSAFCVLLPTVILGVFVLGLVMMAVYYSCFHPSMHNEKDVLSWHNVALSPTVQKRTNVSHVTQS